MNGFIQVFSQGTEIIKRESLKREVSSKKRKADPDESSGEEDDRDVLKDSKILRSTLERGIKKYMMQDHGDDKDSDDKDEDDKDDDDKDDTDAEEDSGIQNDDASVVSDK